MRALLPIVLTGERLPARLSDLPKPPSALFVRGELPRCPAVAIVGTRQATAEGLRFARRLAADLASAGVAVLSGGAQGIDTASHRGALLGRGTTVVVAPSGYACPFPPENAALFRRILEQGGAYVSLVPDDEPATRGAFFSRNACLIALAHAVVVVQAGVRSGARNAAAQARHLGRTLFAVPWGPGLSRGQGCLLELRAGALFCERARDVLAVLERQGHLPVAPKPRRRRRLGRTPDAARATEQARARGQDCTKLNDFNTLSDLELEALVVRRIRDGAIHIDELAVGVGLPVPQLQRLLLTLRLRGVLVSGPSLRLADSNSPNQLIFNSKRAFPLRRGPLRD